MKKNGVSTEQKTDFGHLIKKERQKNKRRVSRMDKYEKLVSRLKKGNQAAASELVGLFYEQIFNYMRQLGHSSQTSEDLTQETFLQIWQHIGQLRSSRALNSWIYRIASNVSKLYWRKHKKMLFEELEADILQGTAKSGNSLTEESEQILRLRLAVAKLPVKFKQAIVLHYMQHLTIAEAAEAMRIREGTFKSRLARGLKRLRKQIP